MTHDDDIGLDMSPRPLPGLSRRRLLRSALATASGLALPALIRPANAAAVTLQIGQIEPLTGASSAYGIRCRDGAASAIAEIEHAGGFHDAKGTEYRLAINVGDMANDARQAITLYRQNALDSSICASIGPTNSVGYVPIVPIAAQLRLLLIGESGAPIKRWTPWAFRVNPVGATAVPVLLRTVVGKLSFKRLALIYDQTQDGQAGDAEVCRQMKATLGYDIVADQAFSSGAQDFGPQIASIANARPDAIFVAAATGDGLRVTAQIRAAGLEAPLMTGYGAFNDPVYWNGASGAIKGGYTWLAQDLAGSTGGLRTWFDAYNRTYPLSATSFSTYGYDCVMSIVEAVKQAGSTDRDKIQEAMALLDFHSPIGTHVTFRNPPTGENLTPTVTVIQTTGPGTYAVVT
jgi:branched-chain amino acid transport system substrate-binding protein